MRRPQKKGPLRRANTRAFIVAPRKEASYKKRSTSRKAPLHAAFRAQRNVCESLPEIGGVKKIRSQESKFLPRANPLRSVSMRIAVRRRVSAKIE